MKEKYIFLLAIVLAAVVFAYIDFNKSNPKIYDCGMAEWHPDIPLKVKEECRKLKREINDPAERNRT